MRDWQVASPVTIADDVLSVVGGNLLVARALFNRGIRTSEEARGFLNPDEYQPTPAQELPGIEASVNRLSQAIREKQPICVWGDFDADGQTSTAILVGTLRELGALVSYHIPVRADESHGISENVLQQWLEQGFRLFLTCDTGISAHKAIELANEQGAEVIVTDHHLLPEILPPALTIVNPRNLPAGHPLSTLPGAGVAYKLSEALFDEFHRREAVENYLDLAAIGIVADLAGLRGEARYLLQRGLDILKTTRRIGLSEMIAQAEIQPERLTEEHIAFGLAPRLNALGRLADANPAVELLTTSDLGRARILAADLEALNAQRRYLTDQVFSSAIDQVDREPGILDRPAIVLSNPNWPAGVIGIVASRLVERYHRPVVIISCPSGEVARGSARSVMGCDITRAITSQASLLQNFGGHPLAAGLSLESINIPDFQRGLNQAVEAQLGSGWREPPLTVDAYLPLSKLDLQFVAEIEKLAPFGPENPPLILASQDLLVQSIRAVGRGGEHRIVRLVDGTGGEFEAIWWQAASLPLPEGKIDLAYSVRSSDFRGQKTISIEWIESRESATSTIDVRKPKGRHIVDFRTFSNSKWKLKEILAQGEVQVWREGEWIDTMPGRTRFELKPSYSLVIWSPPASISILRAAITQVHPSTVYLFNNPVGYSTVKDVLLAVSQHVKYALNHYGGKVELARLAARCGHREATISAALDWLAAKGIVRVLNRSALEYALVSPGQVDPMALQAAKLRIKALLEDTVAYREYYARAECEILLEKDIT